MKFLFEIVSIAKRVIAHLRKQDLQIITRAVDFLGNFHVLLGMHFNKHYRSECEFYRALR